MTQPVVNRDNGHVVVDNKMAARTVKGVTIRMHDVSQRDYRTISQIAFITRAAVVATNEK